MTQSDLPVPVTQRRRRPRLAEKDLREAMYRAAQRMVYEMGVTISLEDLGFEDVIRAADVPRSSAYRLWPYKGDFVTDLLTYLAGPNWLGTAAFDNETVELSYRTVADNLDRLDTPQGRRSVLQEAVRLAAAQNFRAIVESNEFHIYVALVATARSARSDFARRNVTAALATSEIEFIRRMTGFYEDMMKVLGLRLRDPALGPQHLATAGAAVVEGLALRKILLECALALPSESLTSEQKEHVSKLASYINVQIPGPGLHGTAEWSLPALAFLGILDALVEPDPDASLAGEDVLSTLHPENAGATDEESEAFLASCILQFADRLTVTGSRSAARDSSDRLLFEVTDETVIETMLGRELEPAESWPQLTLRLVSTPNAGRLVEVDLTLPAAIVPELTLHVELVRADGAVLVPLVRQQEARWDGTCPVPDDLFDLHGVAAKVAVRNAVE